MRLHPSGHLDVLADARMPLRLTREVDEAGRLGIGAIERTLAALHDFRAVALGAGATSILAVATSAVREAQNGDDLVQLARQRLGIKLVVVDGEREAAFAFLGAVHGLPVDHGLLLDLGGGSLEVSHFRDRKLRRTWTLPLGALRLSYNFVHTDPPSRSELARLRKHIVKTLRKAGVPPLAEDESLIGTGGTIRNIAKIEARSRRDVLPHVHGTVLQRSRVTALARRAGGLRQSSRAGIPGLNKDRADSFLGGLLAVATAMDHLGAESIQVSGQGLREGIALATLGKSPMPADDVRRASIVALARRFATFKRDTAQRRGRIARRLLEILEPGASQEMLETLRHACFVLDVGRSIDYYERHRNAAVIVAAADLQGFTTRGLALLFAVLMHADDAANRIKSLRPILDEADSALIERTATLLLLADEIERRSLPGQPVAVRSRVTSQALVLRSEALSGWRPRSLADRFRRAFGRELRILAA
jgi:exopolyphosphatase/guanosine-5'-triphosphate,3'-diphosphate pyrophosphatase